MKSLTDEQIFNIALEARWLVKEYTEGNSTKVRLLVYKDDLDNVINGKIEAGEVDISVHFYDNDSGYESNEDELWELCCFAQVNENDFEDVYNENEHSEDYGEILSTAKENMEEFIDGSGLNDGNGCNFLDNMESECQQSLKKYNEEHAEKFIKKMKVNEFELLKDAQEVLQMVWDKFDGMGQCEDSSDEIWAIVDCNGFETVRIDYDDETELYSIEVSDCYYDRGNEIREYIEEAKAQIV